MTSGRSPGEEGVTFGRVASNEPESEASEASDGPSDDGGHGGEIDALIARAAVLTPLQVQQLASAAAWRWPALGLPSGGTLASARAAALGAGRRSGRASAIEMARDQARGAALASPGGLATRRGWPAAETALVGLIVGVAGATLSAGAGADPVAVVFAIVGIGSGALLLVLESGYIRRIRLQQVVEAAVLGTVTRDLIEPEAYDLLAGPWRSVVRD
jgi:hypothetical protein